MAIQFKKLQQIADNYTEKSYLYKDLFLDIAQTKLESPGYTLPVPGTDIKADFDVGAIINSLSNLFNTLPGQRFLFPKYGLNFLQYVFQPMTTYNGEGIGNAIFQTIKTFEPRVIPKKVLVTLRPDQNEYEITIALDIPILKISTQTQFLLDVKRQSFIFLPTAKNK